MERKNTLLLTVIAIATLLVAVVGATFAYFSATTNTGDATPVTVTTPGDSGTFTGTGTTIGLTLTSAQMSSGVDYTETNANSEDMGNDLGRAVKYSQSGDISVALSTSSSAYECYYDVNWYWKSESGDNPTTYGATNIYTPTNATLPKEFTLTVTAYEGDTANPTTALSHTVDDDTLTYDIAETDFSKLNDATTSAVSFNSTSLVDTNSVALFKNAYINAAGSSGAEATKYQKYNVAVSFYNYQTVNQTSAQSGKKYKAEIKIENVRCGSSLATLNLTESKAAAAAA